MWPAPLAFRGHTSRVPFEHGPRPSSPRVTANAQAIGQYEVCHHLLGLPPYLSTRSFSTTSLDPPSRALNVGAEHAGELLRTNAYEKYQQREAHTQGKHMIHPVSGEDYSDPVAWRHWVQGSSFYRWFTFTHSQKERGGSGFVSQFRREKPRVHLLYPHLNLYRRLDPAKVEENCYHLRLLLRTYCNLEMAEGAITDESLAAEKSVVALEKLVDAFVKEKPAERGVFKKCCRSPRHIREQWRKAQRQWERIQKKDGEAGEAPPPAYESYEGKVVGAEDGGDAFGSQAEEDTPEQEAARKECEMVRLQLSALGIGASQVRAAYAKIAHPPLRPELDYLQCIYKMRMLLRLIEPQKNPRTPTVKMLKSALQELGRRRAGNKAQLKQRLCNLFNGKGGEAPAEDEEQRPGGPAERVTEQRQELDGRGKNPLEDGRDVAFYR